MLDFWSLWPTVKSVQLVCHFIEFFNNSLKLFSGSIESQFCPVYDLIKPYNTTPIILKDMIKQKPIGFDTISCVQKIILGQKIGCDTVTHPKLFESTAPGTSRISHVKM